MYFLVHYIQVYSKSFFLAFQTFYIENIRYINKKQYMFKRFGQCFPNVVDFYLKEKCIHCLWTDNTSNIFFFI